ncbi:hypothetical protein [Hydrogenophaga sp. 5NK40-0174]|uniref:hypothetical protein n=1 Tax=Hydrogenophaga sp. 5NK40-0174 TaxID=3127649 RepID=UPI003105691C
MTKFEDPAKAMDAALASNHIRVCIAVTAEGKYVVCSRKTARKYGWKLECRVYGDPRKFPKP